MQSLENTIRTELVYAALSVAQGQLSQLQESGKWTDEFKSLDLIARALAQREHELREILA